MKNSFILHHDALSIFDELSDEQVGTLMREIYAYSLYINNPDKAKKPNGLNGLLKIAFHPFKTQLDRDLEKYSRVALRNAENGKKGGRPKMYKNPKKPKKADNDNVNDNVNGNDNVKEKELPYSEFDLFIDTLKSKVSIKSKVTKTKDGRKLFKTIPNKEALMEDYIKHQKEKKEFAQRITPFMEDYNSIQNETVIKPKRYV